MRTTSWLWSICLAIVTAAPPALADDYRIYIILPTNQEMKDRYGRNLENVVDYASMPFDVSGMRIINAGLVGRYPFAGIHLVESDLNYMNRHFEALRKNLHLYVAPDYDGIVTIDYETWWASWDHTANTPSAGGPGDRDYDFKDDWEDYLERYRPEVLTGKTGAARELALRDSYEEATVRFLVATLEECKKLVPNAKWGYFNYPKMLYRSPLNPAGIIGYGDLSYYGSQLNDRLADLWAALDVTAPRVYPPRQTLLEREIAIRDNTPEEQYTFLASHVRESKRLAPHAICVPFGSTRYFGGKHPDLAKIMLNERNTWMQFAVPRDADAEGICVWGDAMHDEMALKTAAYMNEVAGPIARELWEMWYPGRSASAPPPATSGSRTQTRPTAGGEAATAAPVPTDVRIRQSQSGQKPIWVPVRQGTTRVSMPGHSTPPASGPVYRGGRIISWRATGTGDSPPQHRPAPAAEADTDGETSGQD